MDPNATLRIIAEAMTAPDGTCEPAIDAAYDLRTWISSGGFPPHWAMYPKATKFYADYFGVPYSTFYGVLSEGK